ncbi:IspD/TarI family cytidylyltransferase [Sulfuriroseicoccus oceanibius]|uniref:2-C-methyl-D-erythritol 4-phosphate cytidylyltransferase n=1 Tax=Sulfuriroseicoccus oceanibius TaxID=2707525 RepID=A0A6B3L203_9BACT|nr:IspD/TarI family cytidylyltransferase [Sulfuriroseicoccus oceanibius]QQL45559.1 2-C-methyl-D-erythritol 4-phosphate cytidylyltransferase [Sulfuriroseicoccus oceanibius]
MMNERAAAVIVAGGSGRRMGFDKLAAKIGDVSVLERSIAAFEAAETIGRIVVVVSAANEETVQSWIADGRFSKLELAVRGGAERFDSVGNGIAALGEDFAGVIAVHDGARPLVCPQSIDETVNAAATTGAAVLAKPVADTLKRVDANGSVVESVPRDGMWAMETPQCARADWMRQAVAAARSADSSAAITDEVTALQHAGRPVTVVRSVSPNLKITFPGDIELAERLV